MKNIGGMALLRSTGKPTKDSRPEESAAADDEALLECGRLAAALLSSTTQHQSPAEWKQLA